MLETSVQPNIEKKNVNDKVLIALVNETVQYEILINAKRTNANSHRKHNELTLQKRTDTEKLTQTQKHKKRKKKVLLNPMTNEQ